jgi:ATP-dependent exoDNAse (exonuclease V) beta subunit
VVGRDPSLNVNFVSRYANETIQKLLPLEVQNVFDLDRQQRVEESLSLLYVAMTRAKYGLYMYIPGPRPRKQSDPWYNLLMDTLAPKKDRTENAILYEHGEADWYQRAKKEPSALVVESPSPQQISFRPSEPEHRRGLEHIAPSRREGQARVPMSRLFHPLEGTGPAAGTLFHAWFETIEWLDGSPPSDDALAICAAKLRLEMPADIWNERDSLKAKFRCWLQHAAIAAVLRRSAYADPKQPGFPAALKPIWKKTCDIHSVERERRFLVPDGAKFWNGSIDRIVWLGDGQKIVAADVLDFKTDDIPDNPAAIQERTELYRPQLEAYRRVVCRLAHLPEENIALRLLFTVPGKVEDL